MRDGAMNAERLLDVYEQISEAPDAIARLRRFVLDLAVRGRLVEQDPADEPAARLVDRIENQKLTETRSKGVSNIPSANRADEQDLFAIPNTWKWVPAVFPAVGISDQGKKVKTKDVLVEGQFPVVDQGKVRIRGFCDDPRKVIQVTQPMIIFGDHTRETKFIDFDFVVGADGVKILRPVGVEPRYYHLALSWLPLDSRGYGRHFKLLKSSQIPLPPLAEQHRIVAKVDELMALCDRLEEARKTREEVHDKLTAACLARLTAPDASAEDFPTHAAFVLEALPALTTRPDQIKSLRQTILNLAVRGKLVEQDPADEPASEVLYRITKIRADERKRKSSFDPISDCDLPFVLPRNWASARFGEVFSIRTGFAFKSSTYANEGLLVFRVVNFSRDGAFDLSDVKFFPEELLDDKIKSFLLEEGEILMVMVGGTIGKTTRATKEILPALLNQNMWRIRSYGETLSNDYEYLLIRTINQEIDNVTASTHGHFAMSDYEQKPIAIPPLAEQHRIVAKVDALMALCDRLEAALTTTDNTRTRLLEALLHEALAPATDTLEAAE